VIVSNVGSTRLYAASLALILISSALLGLWAAASPSPGEGNPPAVQETVSAYLFWGEGCSLCEREMRFLSRLQERYPGLTVRSYEVWRNQSNLRFFEDMCKAYGLTEIPGVPTLFIGEDFIIGYRSDETTGKQIEELVKLCISRGCLDPIEKLKPTITTTAAAASTGTAGTTEEEATDKGSTCGCGVGREATRTAETHTMTEAQTLDRAAGPPGGLLLFTISIGLIDGFNPCSLWTFCLLLSLLLHASRRHMILVGGAFIAFSALVYLGFLEAWLTINQILKYSEAFRIILGLAASGVGILGVKDFLTSLRGPSLGIPKPAKPRIYRGMRRLLAEEGSILLLISGVASLAFMVNAFELLCTAGLPAAYTRILSAQALPPMIHHAYLGVYILFYMLDEMALLAVSAATLKALKPGIWYGRLAKLVSGALMLALGVILLFEPGALALI
jgi:thiol-disulfide isomerase/thioredoxin